MEHLEKIRDALPDVARDIRVNLQNVLAAGTLSLDQVWGVGVASALSTRNHRLSEALVAEARALGVGEPVLEDARAAAVLMAMNNVFYRFRHLVEKPAYEEKPARLRMQRIAQVTSTKADFELFCLAVSAIGNCPSCVRAHEENVLKHGLTEDHVHDSIRVAATVNAAATALELA
ncbi:MAG: carboxymuconolactone decarboxylase family protein [Deltaproteobacteria bacterium]|nr:carboxymuconolactone decarboxylase family protein [Deltaproteobacteria bacterium]